MTFLVLRVLHVLLAAIWVGMAVFLSFFMMPAIGEAGPAGGPVMAALARRGVDRVIGAIAGLTIVSGIYLYWHFTGGFDPEVSKSHAGMAFGIGGVSGIIAGIIGGAIVGRGAQQMQSIGAQAAKTADGPEEAALFQKMNALRQRVTIAAKIVVVLQTIALSLMAIGHYI